MIEFGKVRINPHFISTITVNDFTHLDRGLEINVKMNNGDTQSMDGCEQWFVDMFLGSVNDAIERASCQDHQ